MDKISSFVESVKEGHKRGDYETQKLTDDVFLEVSVGSFQYGRILVRLWVDDQRIDGSEGTYYRNIYKIDDEYKRIHQSVRELIERHNETEVENHHEWKVQNEDRPDSNTVPDELDPQTTVAFEEFATLRDDVTMAEALMTNRDDGMTRTEIEEQMSDKDD